MLRATITPLTLWLVSAQCQDCQLPNIHSDIYKTYPHLHRRSLEFTNKLIWLLLTGSFVCHSKVVTFAPIPDRAYRVTWDIKDISTPNSILTWRKQLVGWLSSVSLTQRMCCPSNYPKDGDSMARAFFDGVSLFLPELITEQLLSMHTMNWVC